MATRLFFLFHFFVMVFSISLIYLEVFNIENGILQRYTSEDGFYELGSAFLLFFFGIFLFFKQKEFSVKKIKYSLIFLGFIFILGAFEELSWGQHIFGFESVDIFWQYNKQQETNLHNFIPAWLFGLSINLSFYIFFVFLPILAFFYKDKLLASSYSKHVHLLDYLPSLGLVPVFCFGFALQKYFIVDTYADTIALVLALFLLSFIALKKRDSFFTLHLVLVIFSTIFFMYAHEIMSYKNLQYEIREFIFIYTLIFWLLGVIKLLSSSHTLR